MDTPLGRWLLVGLVVLIVIALYLLVTALLPLLEGPSAPAVVIIPTSAMAPTKTPTSTPTPIPTSTPTPTPYPSPTPLPVQVGYTVHVVAEGETLESIAQRYGSIPEAIASVNRFPPEAELGLDQPLVVPLFAGPKVTETIPAYGVEVERGLPGRRVALTFDAGSGAEPAVRILDTLKERGIHVTFFLTGQWAEENPDLVRRIAAEGHEIANHTYNHPHLTQLTEDEISGQIEQTEQIIRDIAGQTTRPFIRPPFGERNQAVLDVMAQEGYISIYWTVDSLDSVGDPKTADFLVERVTHPTNGRGEPISLEGAIFLMHVGNATSADALPRILDWFGENGWQVVKVSEVVRP